MSKKTKKMTLKHFADLKMHAAPIANMLTPQEHPASANIRGKQMLQPTDMSSGDTGGGTSKFMDHSNIQD